MKERYADFSATVKVFTSGLLAPNSLQKASKNAVDEVGDKALEDKQSDAEVVSDEEIIEVEDELAAVETDPMKEVKEGEEKGDVSPEEEEVLQGEEATPVLCVLCYQVQASEGALKSHQEREHSGDLGWVGREIAETDLLHNCGLCSLPFVSWACLKLHFEQQHGGEKPFSQKEEQGLLGSEQFREIQMRKSYRKVLTRSAAKESQPQDVAGEKRNYKRIPIAQKDDATPKIPTDNTDIYTGCIEEKREITKRDVKNVKTKFETPPGPGSYCKLCRKQFKYACLLVTHKKKWHKDEMQLFQDENAGADPKFACCICSQLFLTENILKFHTRTNHTREEKIAAVKKG